MTTGGRVGLGAAAGALLALLWAGPGAAQQSAHPVWQCWIQTEPEPPLYYEVIRLLDREGRDLGSYGQWMLRSESEAGPGLSSDFHATRGRPSVATSILDILWRPLDVEKAEGWRLVKRGGGAVQTYPVKLEAGAFTAQIPLVAFGLERQRERFALLELVDASGRRMAQTRIDLRRLRSAIEETQRASDLVDRRAKRFSKECDRYFLGIAPAAQ